MRKATIRQVRELLPRLEVELQEAGEIVVTRRGQAIARLVPLHPVRPRRSSNADLRAKMPYQTIPSEVLIRQDRDER
jgi:antitoxin (DNA-binding transcriptional repressor) of toxin-antitoxin stability system